MSLRRPNIGTLRSRLVCRCARRFASAPRRWRNPSLHPERCLRRLRASETSTDMQRHITPIACKPWTLNGLSDRLIVSHYEDNYGPAVRSLNNIRDRLAELDPMTAPNYEIRALKREELSAMGSVTLHEL